MKWILANEGGKNNIFKCLAGGAYWTKQVIAILQGPNFEFSQEDAEGLFQICFDDVICPAYESNQLPLEAALVILRRYLKMNEKEKVSSAGAAVHAESQGLAALCGTVAQVEWATRIRTKLMEGVVLFEDNAKSQLVWLSHAKGDTVDLQIKDLEMKLVSCQKIKEIADSAWWIDHRKDDSKRLINTFI